MATENIGAVKIDGYLEKKGKMKVVTTWKKYWFVLEGRLLLYYRSQEEYEKLSPCKGSINMGLATSIRPGLATAGVFQIITRTNTITLRAKERAIQEKWLQALLDASGQQTVTNPIKMSHFRYSMDDLIPTSTKQQHHQKQQARTTDTIGKRTVFTRQNTLPDRFENIQLDRSNTLIERIRQLGGQSYIGSADTLKCVAKQPVVDNTMEQPPPQEEVSVRNDLYAAVLIENPEYVSAEDKADHNKNCYLIENDEYLRSDDAMHQTSSSDVNQATIDDIEYYCTYEEINNLKAQLQSHIYNEPVLPPRSKSDADSDCVSCGGGGKEDTKKKSSFRKFARRLTSFKTTDEGRKKRSMNLIMKVMGKKKHNNSSNSNSSSDSSALVEPIYDTVDYYEIDKANQQKQDAMQLLKTLAELQKTLEAKKSKIKDIIVAGASSPIASTDSDTQAETSGDATSESLKDTATHVPQDTEQPDGPYPPGLPPRHGTRPRSPFHDVPKNNTPVHTPTSEYSLDKILRDLEQQSRHSAAVAAAAEELSVRALIDKFNQSASEPANACATPAEEATNDVALRKKSTDIVTETHTQITNRHSDELNKLLEELTKVTSAPLLTPGVTSSLVQMKSVPLTDEEWLAIAPIRRRRHSEPDYDVPRPHRSLQIIPRSPDTDDTDADTVIPATRFFGPVLPTAYDKHSYPDVSSAWRSMTPDSLEPLQLMHVKRKVGDTPAVRDVLCATVGSPTQLSHFEVNGGGDGDVVESKSPDVFLDSLEPFTESATAF